MKEGRVHEVYNYGGLERTTVSSPEALRPASTPSSMNSSPTTPSPAPAAPAA